jgi:hypothetical protein
LPASGGACTGTRRFGERGLESKHHQRPLAVGQWLPKGTKRSQSVVHRFGPWACIPACWLVRYGKAACLALPPARCAPQLTGSAAAGIIGAGPAAPRGLRLNHTQPCPWYWFRTSGQRYLCFCCGRLLHPVAPFPSPPCHCSELAGTSFHACTTCRPTFLLGFPKVPRFSDDWELGTS